ncbi:TIGR02186 family protein [Benzoatithermus flavus]|uniref:TIGR02186 family protein n=1 Tax=Benzoatithermus flavus TaxID=3108223 RepID=A0ABU8XV47_9PROT
MSSASHIATPLAAGRSRTGRLSAWLAAALAGTVLGAVPAQQTSATFVYDLSSRLIAITTAFVGTQVLIYGAAHQGASEIAVVVRGPARDTTVRRKGRVGPIWINTESLEFKGVPSFYAVAASEPLAELASPGVLTRHELGADNLRLTPVDAKGMPPTEIAAFREALIRNKQRAGLYSVEPGTVSFLGQTLFRTRITFPANVPPGIYQVQVFEFADGEVTGAQTSTLEISKMGIEADLYDFALHRPAFYGLASILMALAAGFLADAVFRRA